MPQIKFTLNFLPEILHFKESHNLIGWQHFDPQLETQNFVRYCGEIPIIILVFCWCADWQTDKQWWLYRTLCRLGVQSLKYFRLSWIYKNQFIPLISSWDTAHFWALHPEWAHPFMAMLTPIFFNQHSISMNLYQHAKIRLFRHFVLEI